MIYYNVKDGKQVSYIDPCNDIPDCESDMKGGEGVRISDNTACQVFQGGACATLKYAQTPCEIEALCCFVLQVVKIE